jgi:hypothetical protein
MIRATAFAASTCSRNDGRLISQQIGGTFDHTSFERRDFCTDGNNLLQLLQFALVALMSRVWN